MDTNSYIVDRGDAVNLARTVLERPGDPEITNKGIEKLARAVLDMDDWISLHSGPSRKGSDTARLDLIENTQTYPWRDFGCWKFRSGKKFYQGDTVRAVLDAALHDLPTATKD